MKSRILKKALSIIVVSSIIVTSIQVANPVVVYAEEEESQADSGSDPLVVENTESVSDETKATDGSGEGQEIESVSENAENTKSNQELNIEEPEANEGVVGNGIPEVEIEAYADAMPEEWAAAVMNVQSEGMPEAEVNTVSEETPIDESVSEELAAESTLSGGVAQENADIENSKTDIAATEEDESKTLSDEKSEKEDLTEESSNQETDSDAIGKRTVLGEASGEVSNDFPGDDNSETHYPYNQYAVEGYGADNENRGDSATLDVVLGNGIRFILSGVNDFIVNNNEAKQVIVNTIKEFMGIGESNNNDGTAKTLQYMNSTAFIDAEKYSIINEGYDSNYCWGATASNMLWLSGWAKEVLGYDNEDKVMSDLHDKFLDVAEEPRDAITWLFDNYINNVEVSTKTESTLGGKAASICISEAFNTYENVAGQLQNLANLANVASQAVGIQCRWTKDGQVKDGSHWLTAVGVVINETANSIEDYFKAIILADSDDTPGTATTTPSNTESYNQRRDTVNLYKISTLETVKVNGVDYWCIPGYQDIDGEGALITGIESLQYYSESLKGAITEQHGTKDASNSLELIYSGIMYPYGNSVTEPQYDFCEESANVRIGYTNTSGKSVEDVEVPVRVTICDTNRAELDSNLYYVPASQIAGNSRGYFDININDLTNGRSAGDYFIRVMFNPYDAEGRLEEAYYLNNDLVSTWITITEKPVIPAQDGGQGSSNIEQESNNTLQNEQMDSIDTNSEKDAIMAIEQIESIDAELQKEGISKDTIKAIDQMFSQSQITYFAPETKIDTANGDDYKVFMAGTPGEFISAEIDGVKLDLSELKILPNSTNSYRVVLDGKMFKGLKKGKHKLVIYSVRGALPIVIEITVV